MRDTNRPQRYYVIYKLMYLIHKNTKDYSHCIQKLRIIGTLLLLDMHQPELLHAMMEICN